MNNKYKMIELKKEKTKNKVPTFMEWIIESGYYTYFFTGVFASLAVAIAMTTKGVGYSLLLVIVLSLVLLFFLGAFLLYWFSKAQYCVRSSQERRRIIRKNQIIFAVFLVIIFATLLLWKTNKIKLAQFFKELIKVDSSIGLVSRSLFIGGLIFNIIGSYLLLRVVLEKEGDVDTRDVPAANQLERQRAKKGFCFLLIGFILQLSGYLLELVI